METRWVSLLGSHYVHQTEEAGAQRGATVESSGLWIVPTDDGARLIPSQILRND